MLILGKIINGNTIWFFNELFKHFFKYFNPFNLIKFIDLFWLIISEIFNL